MTLHGFKSFPERVSIQFHSGVTAVVGPNGSGKSNISDAIRWVLGEQSSKALRVKSMEDLIFGGTPYKRPQGFALVELALDNTDRSLPVDTDEVIVSRRLYRSGDSEYRINQKIVRLRDIHELFMDTGLGRDGYSIIGQGRIAEIVAAKSTDRRDIFEEAAGIAKFRYRRAESERQLAAAEENLVRIRDIEHELAERVEPLRVQSEKAKEFLKLSEQKKQLDVSLSVLRYHSYSDTLRDLDAKLCIHQAQVDEMEAADQQAEAQIAQCYEQMQQLAARIDQARRQVHDNESQIAGSSSEIAVLQNEILHANEALARIEQDLAVNQKRYAQSEEEIAQQNGQSAALLAQLAAYDEQIGAIEQQIAENSEQLQQFFALQNTLSEQLQAAAAAIGEQNYELARLEAQHGEWNRRIEELQDRIEQREFDRDELDARCERETRAAEKLQAQIAAAEARVLEAQKQLQEQKQTLEAHTRALQALAQKRDAAAQRVTILQELERNMEGYYGSVRQILSAARQQRLFGIRGVVSELIEVDKTYAVAMEIALGSALQNIVCDTERDAKAAIAYLQRGSHGRATFLPLDTVHGEVLRNPLSGNVSGYLGVAASLVRCDPMYEGVVASLLGRILIATDLDAASEIARLTGRRYRVVTVDGQVINAGGSYTGGSLGKNSGLLSRRNEIAAWETERDRLHTQVQEQTAAIEAERSALEAAEQKLRPRLSALEEERRALVRQTVERDNLLQRLASLDEELAQSRLEKESVHTQLQTLTEQRTALKEKIRAMEDEQLSIFDRISRENAATADLRAENESRISEKNRLAIHRVATEKDIERCEETQRELQLRQQNLQAEAAQLREQSTAVTCSIAEWEEKIRQTAVMTDELTADNRRQDEAMQQLMRERNELEQTIAQKRAEQRAQSSDRERLAADIARLTERQASVEAEQEKSIARLWDEYELSKQDALQMAKPLDNPTARAAELTKLRSAIKALGSVNVGAIDEYETVRTRYEFLIGQIADIEKAKGELSSIIAELDRNMRSMFKEAFTRIAEAFSQLFSEFFGGGRAYLELTDPDRLLESGIEISVQPPGKIVKNLATLSGGEQAFVAIALYFAIQRVRPSPFCLLDEIESALDDINVTKYAKYLKTVEKTQMITITHRRGTMEQADVLYGVTTQQDGVSRVLTLNLGEAVETIGK